MRSFVSSIVVRLLALLAMASTGCQGLRIPPVSQAALAHRDTIPWKREQVVGLRVSRVDANGAMLYRFSEGGHVAVTAESRGKSTAPLFGWKLHRGRLLLHDAGVNGRVWEWYLVALGSETLRVRGADGGLVEYRVNHE